MANSPQYSEPFFTNTHLHHSIHIYVASVGSYQTFSHSKKDSIVDLFVNSARNYIINNIYVSCNVGTSNGCCDYEGSKGGRQVT